LRHAVAQIGLGNKQRKRGRCHSVHDRAFVIP
jgi:hypothetical protein